MIKVLHIIGSMNDGGAQKIILNYVNDLQNDKDIEISLLVLDKKTNHEYCKFLEKCNIQVTYLNCFSKKRKIKVVNIIANNYNANKKIYDFLSKHSFDEVHVHLFGALKFSMKAIVKSNIPVRFYTLHSAPSRFKGARLKILRKAFTKNHFIPICVTEEQANFAKNYYKFSNYEVVHNGVDFDSIKLDLMPKKKAREIFALKDEFVIIAVGRLDSIKRFDFLITIFNDLLKTAPNSKLLIAGDGSERKNLENLVSKFGIGEKVKFLGFLGKITNVVKLYSAADVLAVTSESESASLVLLEAQACDLRCVISNGVPSESIITNKVQKMSSFASKKDWINALLNFEYNGEHKYDFKDYEVHEMSNKIKKIYLKYWEEYLSEKK